MSTNTYLCGRNVCYFSVTMFWLNFYRAMLCIRCSSHGPVSVSVCLCLCLTVTVTSRCSTKMAKRRITQTTPHDSPGTPGSREQFLHCGLRKFRHSKSLVYRWYTQLDRCWFVYETYKTMKATRTRHGWVHMFIAHWPTLTLQLRNFDLFRTSRTSSFCTLAWQLARFQLTRHIVRSLGDSWAFCSNYNDTQSYVKVWWIYAQQHLRLGTGPKNTEELQKNNTKT